MNRSTGRSIGTGTLARSQLIERERKRLIGILQRQERRRRRMMQYIHQTSALLKNNYQ